MKASIARFDGETVLFIKPDGALELIKIAMQLGINVKDLEPRQARVGTGLGKPFGFKHERNKTQECFYCKEEYVVSIVRPKAWRHACKKPKCRSRYTRDRLLYKQDPHEYNRRLLAQNMRESGLKVKLEKRR